MNEVTIIAIIGAICTAIGSILTLWWTKGVEAQIMLMKARRENFIDDLDRSKIQISEIKATCEAFEMRLMDCLDKHHECEVRCAGIAARLDALEERLEGHKNKTRGNAARLDAIEDRLEGHKNKTCGND